MKFITGMVCALLFAFEPASAAKILLISDYFGTAEHRNFSISPNGRYLAVVRDLPKDEVPQLTPEDFEKEKGRRQKLSLVDYTRGDQIRIFDFETSQFINNINIPGQSVYWLRWANDNRLLASISTTYDLNYGRRLTIVLPAARTISFNYTGADEPVTLFANDRAVLQQNLYLSSIADPLADDPDHVLMSAYKNRDLDLWRVNVNSGDAERIAVGSSKTFAWITDGQSQPVFRLDQNSNGTVMYVNERTDSGRWRRIITTRLNEKGQAPHFWPIARGDNPNEIFVLTSPPGQSHASISKYDLTKSGATSVHLIDGKYDFSGGLINPHTGQYFGAWIVEDRYRMVLEDENLQNHINAINTFFEDGANVEIVATSRDLSRLLLEVSSPTIPGEIYAYDRNASRIEPVFNIRPNLTTDHLASVELIDVKTKDGETLRAYLSHPAGLERTTPGPLVVLPHGGPSVRDMYDFDPTAQFLASRGYRVLQINFRGSSGYGRAFEEAGYREWGGRMHSDMMDALEALYERNIIANNRVCIMGSSYGGYAALYAAMAEPDKFKCAISIAGVTDLPDLLKHERENNRDLYDFAKVQIGDPRSNKTMLVARSPARNPERLDKVPLLLIHGKQDQIVPYRQFLKLTDALDKLEIEYEWVAVADGHTFEELSSTVRSMRRVEAFLAKHLGGKISG